MPSGIFNVGCGVPRSFADLGKAVFSSMGIAKPSFEWIEMPEEMKSRYQYFTSANLVRMRQVAGYTKSFHSLEESINDYVQGYLSKADGYL